MTSVPREMFSLGGVKKYYYDGYIRERLDHVVATPEWRDYFPAYKINNGDPHHSNHRLWSVARW